MNTGSNDVDLTNDSRTVDDSSVGVSSTRREFRFLLGFYSRETLRFLHSRETVITFRFLSNETLVFSFFSKEDSSVLFSLQ